MERVVILSPTDSDAATIAGSSAVSSLPVANALAQQPRKVWRTTGAAAEWATVSLKSAIAANGLAIVWPSKPSGGPTAAATIRVRGKATSDVTTSPTVDTGAVSMWPATGKPTEQDWPNYLTWISWANTTPMAYWRVDFADATAPAGYLDIGRLMLGTYWQPTTNFDLSGSPLGFDQRDVQITTDYGFTFTDRRAKSAARRFSLTVTAANKREVLGGVAEIQRLRGQWGDVAIILDPAETTDFHRFAMQGRFVNSGAPATFPIAAEFDGDGNRYGANLTLLEVL